MKWSRWTPEACSRLMDLYSGGYSAKEIAAMMGRTEHAVRLRLLGSGCSSRRIKTDNEPLLPPPADAAVPKRPGADGACGADHYESRARAELEAQLTRREERGKVEQAKRLLLEDRIAGEFSRVLSDLPRTPLKIAAPPVIRDADGSALTAVLVVGDVHLGQIVCPHETAGFGCYNPAIALARVRHLEIEAARIMSERRLHGEREASWRERCTAEANEGYVLMAGENKEALLAAACEAIDDLALPFEANARVMLEDDVSVHLDIDLPEIETVVPQILREVSSTGSIKSSKRSGQDLNEPYAELVFGHCLNLSAKLFVQLPRLQTAKLAAYTRRSSSDDYVLECTVTREVMTKIASSAPEKLPDLISALAHAEAVYELAEDSRLKAIGKPPWTEKLACL